MSSLSQTYQRFKWFWFFSGLLGLAAGLFVYILVASRAFSYFSNDSEVCLNCHVMGPYYQSYRKSSHALRATCNDCHVPQDNTFRGYAFKAYDGLYHAAVYTARLEPQVIRANEGTKQVILENCIRCHKPLVEEFVKMDSQMAAALKGQKLTCFDCHRDSPHNQVVSLSTDNIGAGLPLPGSPAPDWLESLVNPKPAKTGATSPKKTP
ncbi:MAG: cytochrome c nitrite reductase small subunit [Deltaproteobacteria bacterium]|jgi:cytochrome c nitrite reductase small subunit|nr:cytochrome c nitrite reductase small subunit [Deltaproteobacteria bacterium]